MIEQDCEEEEGRGWSKGKRWKVHPEQEEGSLSLDTGRRERAWMADSGGVI